MTVEAILDRYFVEIMFLGHFAVDDRIWLGSELEILEKMVNLGTVLTKFLFQLYFLWKEEREHLPSWVVKRGVSKSVAPKNSIPRTVYIHDYLQKKNND